MTWIEYTNGKILVAEEYREILEGFRKRSDNPQLSHIELTETLGNKESEKKVLMNFKDIIAVWERPKRRKPKFPANRK